MRRLKQACEDDWIVAERCAARILDHWQRRGLAPDVWTEAISLGAGETRTWGIRSDMVGGRPRPPSAA